jgi:hypothetical protein
MSKRQRRRVSKRRTMHMEHVKRRGVFDPRLPIALAAVVGPAVAAPAAHAALRAHHLEGSALTVGRLGVPVHGHHLHRLTGSSFTGLGQAGAAAAPATTPTPTAAAPAAPAAPATAATTPAHSGCGTGYSCRPGTRGCGTRRSPGTGPGRRRRHDRAPDTRTEPC